MATLPGLPGDVYFGDPDEPLPDWRATHDHDDDLDDNEDPAPIGRKFLNAALGFDIDELDDDTDQHLMPPDNSGA